MVLSCVAINCVQRWEKGVSFHSFPKDPSILKKWLSAMHRDNWFPKKRSVLCSKHFSPDCYQRNGWSSRASLKPDAVPSIFSFPNYIQKSIQRRSRKRYGQNSKNILSSESQKIIIPDSALNKSNVLNENKILCPDDFAKNKIDLVHVSSNSSTPRSDNFAVVTNSSHNGQDPLLENSAFYTNNEMNIFNAIENLNSLRTFDSISTTHLPQNVGLPLCEKIIFHANCSKLSEVDVLNISENSKSPETYTVPDFPNSFQNIEKLSNEGRFVSANSISYNETNVTNDVTQRRQLHKEIIKMKNAQIKMLQQRNRRLTKKLEELQSVIIDLIHKDLSSAEALEALKTIT